MKKLLLLLIFVANLVYAEEVIEIVVPVSPGGASDITSHMLSIMLSNRGVKNIINYKTGGQGDVAYAHMQLNHNNTILNGATSDFVYNHVVKNRENLHAQTMTFFSPIIDTPTVFVSNPTGYQSLSELIAAAKKDTVLCAAGGAHAFLAIRYLNNRFGTHFEPVPYKGGAQLTMAVASKEVACGFDGFSTEYPNHKAGLVRILAVSDRVRGVDLPLISTTLPGFQLHQWLAFAVPNDSNLLHNPVVVDVLTNFVNYLPEVENLMQTGYIPMKPVRNPNQYIEEQTQHFRRLVE